MPTATQIDLACREGYFVYVGNRQQVSGAQSALHGVPAKPGEVWVYVQRTGLWEEIAQTKVTITKEPFNKKGAPMATQVTDIRSKKSGKRSGGGHTGLPSDSARRAAGNGKAEDPVKDVPEKKKRATTVTVSRTTAKQGELPGVQTSRRKIQEIG